MNFVRHTLNEWLFFLQVFVALVAGVIALVVLCRAYRQTRFSGLLWLILGWSLSLITTLIWDVFGHYRPYPSIYVALVIGYRAIYAVDAIISIVGTVLLVREFVRLYRVQKTCEVNSGG